MVRSNTIRHFSSALGINSKKIAFSGIQPTGALHLGNYLGALKQWVENQDAFLNLYCVVDLHAITSINASSPNLLRKETFEAAAMYLAAGKSRYLNILPSNFDFAIIRN